MPGKDSMCGSYIGPELRPEEIEEYLRSREAVFQRIDRPLLLERVAQLLADEHVVGWFNGRMEFGPRALGNRSILGDARSPRMQAKMNLKIKFREGFRPFAPSVLRERVADYFELDRDSPYMLLVAPVRFERRIPMSDEQDAGWGIDKLNVPRSDIPAVTHIDYSARIQTVHRDSNPRLLRPAQGVREPHGVQRPRQHVVQRPWGADCMHRRGCVPVLHAHQHRLPGPRTIPLVER